MTPRYCTGAHINHSIVFATALVASVLLGSSTSRAENLDDVLDAITTQVATFLKSRNESTIAIGSFNGPPTVGTGRKIASDFKQKLTESGLTVSDNTLDANFELRGEFRQIIDGPSPLVAMKVKLFDSNGNEVVAFRERFREFARPLADKANVLAEVETARRQEATGKDASTTASDAPQPRQVVAAVDVREDEVPIDAPQDVERLTVPTVDVTRQVEAVVGTALTDRTGDNTISAELRQKALASRSRALREALAKPTFHLDGKSIVAADESSPFRIEILVKRGDSSDYVPIPIQNKGGLAFAPLQEGDLYAIRVYNDADFDVGVKLAVDGVNTMEFSEQDSFRKTGKWAIRAHSSGLIKGYHINASVVDAFRIAAIPSGKSTVENQLARPDRIGTVHATFHIAWSVDQSPPTVARILGPSRNLQTVRGPRIDAPSETIERVYCRTAIAFVGIRYLNPTQD